MRTEAGLQIRYGTYLPTVKAGIIDTYRTYLPFWHILFFPNKFCEGNLIFTFWDINHILEGLDVGKDILAFANIWALFFLNCWGTDIIHPPVNVGTSTPLNFA